MQALSNTAEWQKFLKEFADRDGVEEWPGNAGASEQQLVEVEARLKVKLPPSYRNFLSASNGWRRASTLVPDLRSVEKIKWFRKEHKDWLGAYQLGAEPLSVMERDYFNYADQDCVIFEVKHFAQTLCISGGGDDAVLLLNPMVVWPDGEWEFWFFANSLPGAVRYHSFADWMRCEYCELVGEPVEHTVNAGELPTVYLDAPGKPDRRIRPREEVLVLETVLARIKSKKKSDRVKAAKQLAYLGGELALDALLNSLKSDPEEQVRWAAVDSLGRLAAPETVEAIIAAVDDPLVNSSAIHALAKFKDERSAQFLLKVLEEGGLYAATAVSPLSKRGESRAVIPLTRFLAGTAAVDRQHIGDIAGRLLAQFGDAGYKALEPLMTHPDARIRKRAERGIADIAYLANEPLLRRKAYDLLQKSLETETDAELRRWIEVSIKISAKKNTK